MVFLDRIVERSREAGALVDVCSAREQVFYLIDVTRLSRIVKRTRFGKAYAAEDDAQAEDCEPRYHRSPITK